METVQTAVEWLENELHNFIHPEHSKDFLLILEQAKQMEKEQIKEAYCKGDDNIGAEQYYKETYESNTRV